MSIYESDNCTHNCNTCSSACSSADGERKPSFFDRLETVSERYEEIGEDNMLKMLDDLVKELEKEE